MSQAQQPKTEYIDRPDLTETFVDNVRHVTFDGATVRVELAVTRFEETAGATPAVAKQYPASRIVLRPDAAVDLFVRLQRLIALMEQRGIVRREQPKQEGKPADAPKAADALENPLGKAPKANPKH
jgi:hypothetical protein